MAVEHNDGSEKDLSIENHRLRYVKTQSLITTSPNPNMCKQ